jgi:hypothetical protein
MRMLLFFKERESRDELGIGAVCDSYRCPAISRHGAGDRARGVENHETALEFGCTGWISLEMQQLYTCALVSRPSLARFHDICPEYNRLTLRAASTTPFRFNIQFGR